MRRLQSGKFWLKCLVGGTVLSALAFGAQYALLSWLFSPENVRRAAEEAVAGTGRKIRYRPEIKTSVIPRPTVTLKQVEIIRPGGASAEISIEEMRVGLSWASLFGTPSVEKWVFVRPELMLNRSSDGGWNIRDLLQKEGSLPVDRLIVEDGRLLLDTGDSRHTLENINLKINDADGSQTTVKAEGRLKTPLWAEEAEWKFEGTAARLADGWQMPDLALSGRSSYKGDETNFLIGGNGSWRTGGMQLNNARLKIDIPARNLHLNAESPQIKAGKNQISASAANAVLTAQYGGAQWDGTIAAKRLTLHPTVAAVEKLSINGSRKTALTQTAFTLDTPLNWQRQGGWEMPAVKLTTRLDNITGNPRPRLISELAGTFRYQNGGGWQGWLTGRLDRQAAELDAAYTVADRPNNRPAKLTANLQLDKLALSPYLEGLADTSVPAYPAWLQKDGAPEIEATVRIKTLQSPNLEINNLTTRLLADRERIVLPDFRAELYNGSMEGGISMANTSPPTYHLQQYAKNINIRPLMQDLFRYGNISGEGDVEIDLTAQGADRAGLTKTLSGRLQLNLTKGNWLGINLDQALQSLLGNKPVNTDERSATPFQRFSMSSTIRNGISSHENAELDSNRLHIVLTGSTDFNNMTLNERLLLSPADGKGTPIPLNIRGKADNPSITLDYKGLTEGLETAEEKQQALTRAIREQWQWLNRPSENGK